MLLARGAARVVALDVGTAQLDWRLRTDPRVVCIEGVNARYLTPDQLPADARHFDIITIDASFISLRHTCCRCSRRCSRRRAASIALVKPQFEAGRDEVGAGRHRPGSGHPRARRSNEVADAALRVGLTRLGRRTRHR